MLMEVKARLERSEVEKIVINDLLYHYALCTRPHVKKALKRVVKHYTTKEEFEKLRFD